MAERCKATSRTGLYIIIFLIWFIVMSIESKVDKLIQKQQQTIELIKEMKDVCRSQF